MIDIYKQYKTELRTSITSALRSGRSRSENEQSFRAFVPLWTLISGLQDTSSAPNPTKAMIMSYLREANDLETFLAVSRDHHIERTFGVALQGAHRALNFVSYFDELVSDSLLFVNAFHLNNYRGCMIALRCMLEDLYRHLYYKDNRENFIRVHELGESEHELKLSPAAFRSYLDKASYLALLHQLTWTYSVAGKNIKGIVKLNGELYARTSAFVHGSSPATLNGFASNLDFTFDAAKAASILEIGKHLNEMSVAFLCSAHLDQFSRLNEATKRIVFDTFNGPRRSEFRQLIRV
jgi:hypothetical protein